MRILLFLLGLLLLLVQTPVRPRLTGISAIFPGNLGDGTGTGALEFLGVFVCVEAVGIVDVVFGGGVVWVGGGVGGGTDVILGGGGVIFGGGGGEGC